MSNKKTLEQMSTTEAKRAGITSLADRPNDKSRYGDGGLSAEMLKARFDALPNLVREKFNKIAEMLAGTDAAKYITLDDERLGETLYDFLLLFGARGDGITDKNISDLIETLYQGEGDEGASSRTLKDIVASICARLVALKSFADESLGSIDIYVDGDGGIIYETADRNGLTVNLSRLDPIGKDGIGDGAVSFEKLDAELGGRVSRAFAKARYTASDGKLHFDSADGVELDSIDLPLESIIVSGAFDTSTKDLVFTLVGGGTLRIPFDAYIDAVASEVARLNAKTDKSFKTATLAGDDTLVFETHDGTVSTVDLSTVALDGQTRDTIARLENNDADHERRISLIEEHISNDYFVTDNSVAYEKAVPARACSSAKLLSLGGMTYKSKNLFNPSNIVDLQNLTNDGGVLKQVQADTYQELFFRVQKWKGANFVDFAVSVFAVHGGLIKCSFVKDDTFDIISIGLNGQVIDTVIKYDVSNLPNGTYYLSLNMTNATQGSITFEEIMFSTEDVPYEPYYEGLRDSKVTEIKSYGAKLIDIVYPIPAEIQVGKGINGYVDTIDFDAKKRTQRVNTVVFTGNEIFSASGYYFITTTLNVPKGAGTYAVMLSEKFPVRFSNAQLNNFQFGDGEDSIFNHFADLTEFKAYLAEQYANGTPVTVVYALAEPIETDISEALESFDNIIEVEGGGSLEFVNEYKNPVPSAVKYLLKEESAV